MSSPGIRVQWNMTLLEKACFFSKDPKDPRFQFQKNAVNFDLDYILIYLIYIYIIYTETTYEMQGSTHKDAM